MKILTISEVYPDKNKPQYGVFIEQQVEELEKLGNQIDILMPCSSKINGTIEEGVWNGRKIYSVNYRTNRYQLFLKNTAKSCYASLKTLIKQNGYDALAVHITGDAVLKIITDIGKELKIPVFAHYHGLNVWKEFTNKHRIREKFYASRRARILKNTKAIIGVSDKVSNEVRLKIKKVPVYTVYNGVEVEKFTPTMQKTDNFTIVGVGNLIAIKGFKYLIEAFSKLYKENPSVRLKIIGDGVERTSLEQQVKDNGLEKAVTFFGKIPYDKVAEEMKNSHLFVLPSYYEALGCVYLEAMACGVPTIGVKGMGIDEIIIDGENGLLVEPKNIEDLYKKMLCVVNDKGLAEKLGEYGRETALKYTWEQSAINLDKIYKGIVNG